MRDERILSGGILKWFSPENRGQNIVRSGIHDIVHTANLNCLVKTEGFCLCILIIFPLANWSNETSVLVTVNYFCPHNKIILSYFTQTVDFDTVQSKQHNLLYSKEFNHHEMLVFTALEPFSRTTVGPWFSI